MLSNAKILGGVVPGQQTNELRGTGQMRQYMAAPTRRHLEEMAKYATDYFAAEVQGLNPDKPCLKEWYEIRAADVFSSLGISSTSKMDDWKNVYFKRPDIDYVPPGTKFWFWKNVWLADNPSNTGSIAGNALVRRCNAVWNSLDYYGNIVAEPFVMVNQATKANANTDTEFMKLADNYSDCIMQANPWTLAHLKENTRIALGTGIYAVRGLSNYIREFTYENESVRLIYFSVYYQEPVETDDMTNLVADGLAFHWEIIGDAPRSVTVGQEVTITPASIRNNESPTLPVSYLWESQTPDIASIDETGKVTALTEGQAVIRCTLEQNPNIYTDFQIEVAAQSALAWASTVPAEIPQFTNAILRVTEPVTWSVAGGVPQSFDCTTTDTSITINCYYPVDAPVIVTATAADGQALTATIYLTAR